MEVCVIRQSLARKSEKDSQEKLAGFIQDGQRLFSPDSNEQTPKSCPSYNVVLLFPSVRRCNFKYKQALAQSSGLALFPLLMAGNGLTLIIKRCSFSYPSRFQHYSVTRLVYSLFSFYFCYFIFPGPIFLFSNRPSCT